MVSKTKIKRINWFLIIIVLLAAGLIYSIFVEPNWLQIRHFTYANKEVPANFAGKKIVFVSDIHVNRFYGEKKLDKLVENINDQKPDIVLFGGDFVDSEPIYLQLCFDKLKNVSAGYGKYAILGNHDWKRKIRQSFDKKYFSDAGITLLDNSSEWIEIDGERVKIGGVSDYVFFDDQDVSRTTADVAAGDLVILGVHEPDFLETLDNEKIDITFSGHTHGGQVNFFGLWAPIKPTDFGMKYLGSTIEQNNITSYISRGAGNATIPIRFFARPDILVVELQK